MSGNDTIATKPNSFVHLHVHSQYSLLEASTRIGALVKKAVAFQQPAVALTDNGNMFGAVEFYFAAKDAGLKPLIGMDAYLAPKSRLIKGEDREAAQMPNTRLVMLAQNYRGYQNLCALSSVGYQEGFYYKPRLDYEVLKKHSEDLIVLSGGSRGDVAHAFLTYGEEAALEKIRALKSIYDDRFYLEINRTGGAEWDKLNAFFSEAAKITGVPLVAANNVHYLLQEDQLAQEVLICIGSNKTIQDESRYRLGSDQFYLKSSEQMRELFHDQAEACDRTLEIAERCDVKFKLKDDQGKAIYHLPTFPTENGRTQEDAIREKALQGLELRYQEAVVRNETVSEELKPKYLERLDFELKVISTMGFTSYFLIVQDFINWAKDNNIPVGPGRGSGAGSLVSYCLRITDLDPVRYNLLFERFLNPERISMPDFDVDFCQDKRQLVIDYVTQKYTQANVSQIITFGKLQARAAIRDVGRVLGMLYAEVDVISKLMPDKLGLTIKEALEMEPRLREQIEVNPQVATLMDMAQKIEGLVRHAGIHAAGVVIANNPLVELAPLYRGADGENVVQFDMKYAEKIGLIKFDFLGLKTLTHIQNAMDLIEQNRGRKIVSSEIPVSDPGIYEIMSRGDTLGIFQFEGDGITDTVKKIKPTCFEDITAINALYRPGPMDMIPEYTKRKHGEAKVEYIFAELEDILGETYGIIIYQEQVMAIASRIANYSLGEADLLRRAMGKKIASEMDAQKERFLSGAAQNKHDPDKAGQLFELMKEFANYGFNKSHAAAYCVVAAQTAWLKNYYPIEFYAALLSTEMSNTDNVVRYVKAARSSGIQVMPPNVNHSDYKFTVRGETIYFSLGAIKGVGEGAVQAIIDARNLLPSKAFATLEEFFEKVDTRKVNKKALECLIKAGAFDGFGFHRAQLIHSYEKFLEWAETKKSDKEIGQGNLFAMMMDADSGEALEEERVQVSDHEPWPRAAQLQYEKEVLGFFLSDHPLAGLDYLYKQWITCSIDQLKTIESKKRVVVAGLITSYRDLITKKGTRMAFAQIEDLTGSVELVVFPEALLKHELHLKDEQPVLIGGVLERDGDSCKILLDRAGLLDEMLKKTKRLVLKLDESMQGKLPELADLMKRHPGKSNVELQLEMTELKKTVTMDVSENLGVAPGHVFFEGLQKLFGKTDFIEIRS